MCMCMCVCVCVCVRAASTHTKMCDDIEQELQLNFMAMDALINNSADERVLYPNHAKGEREVDHAKGEREVDHAKGEREVEVRRNTNKKRRHNERCKPLAEMQQCKLKRGRR